MENTSINKSKNNEQFESSKNDSGFIDLSFENPLLLTNDEEHHSLNQLNNRLANYIEHVRQEQLIAKSTKTFEEMSQIPSIQLENLKSLYESEIRNLRDALDKQSNDMASLTVNNDKLIAENKNLKLELDDKVSKMQNLNESLQKVEYENTILKSQIHELKNNQIATMNLSKQLKESQKQLELEVLLRTSAENACLTYKEKMEFNEAVFKKELGALMITHRSAFKRMTTLKNDIQSSNLLEQMENARSKLRDYLNEFRISIDVNFLDSINRASNTIADQINKRSKSKTSNEELLKSQNNLIMELEKIKSSHIKLENQISNLQTLNEEEIKRLRRIISELSNNKINDLETHFNELKDLNRSISEKALLDGELAIYRKMLESEESRTDCNDISSSPPVKRRKTTLEMNENMRSRPILTASRQKKSCAIM